MIASEIRNGASERPRRAVADRPEESTAASPIYFAPAAADDAGGAARFQPNPLARNNCRDSSDSIAAIKRAAICLFCDCRLTAIGWVAMAQGISIEMASSLSAELVAFEMYAMTA